VPRAAPERRLLISARQHYSTDEEVKAIGGVGVVDGMGRDRRNWADAATVAAMTEAWTAPQVERTEPGRIAGERQALEERLD
jgi:hypothetical protein